MTLCGGLEIQLHSLLTRPQMEVGGQLHVLADLLLVPIEQEARWAPSQAG